MMARSSTVVSLGIGWGSPFAVEAQSGQAIGRPDLAIISSICNLKVSFQIAVLTVNKCSHGRMHCRSFCRGFCILPCICSPLIPLALRATVGDKYAKFRSFTVEGVAQ